MHSTQVGDLKAVTMYSGIVGIRRDVQAVLFTAKQIGSMIVAQ